MGELPPGLPRWDVWLGTRLRRNSFTEDQTDTPKMEAEATESLGEGGDSWPQGLRGLSIDVHRDHEELLYTRNTHPSTGM